MNDRRETDYNELLDATGEKAKSKALDVAVRYYLRMRGDTLVIPKGQIPELMAAAESRGSLTAGEIAEILNSEELPIEHESNTKIGRQ